MNNERRRVVHGSYNNQEELVAEITRLQNEGYKREDIVVYSSRVATDTSHHDENVVDDPMKLAPGSTDGAVNRVDGEIDSQKRALGSTDGDTDVTDGIVNPNKRAPGSTNGSGDLTDGVTEPRKQAPGPTDVERDDLETADENPRKQTPGPTGVEDNDAERNRTHRTTDYDNDDDKSLWDKVKDFFTEDTYDYDKESQNPNYRKENDVLYPHRQDLAEGNRVIVLDKPNEEETRINI